MAFDLETSPAPGLAHPSEPARAEPAGGDAKSVPPAGRRRLSKRARILLVVALAVLLLGGGGTAYLLTRSDDSTGVTYRTQTIATSTLKSTVSATGTLDPAREADLSFAQAGTVTSVKVSVGDRVTKGQVLATIGDDDLQIAYTEAKATLAEAKADLADLDDDADGTATDTEIASAEATVRSDRAAVKTARAALADATLRATFSGLVADVGISKGDSTGGGTGSSGTSTSSSSSSSGAVTVISQGTFTVTTAVSTSDVGSVKKGLQAVITPTGTTDDVYGTVSSVGVVASESSDSSSGSATFPVTIKVTGTHQKLLPGSSASVEIVVKQLTDVIAVPTQAITTTQDQGDDKTVVQRLVDGKQVATEVTLGQTLGNQTVVTKGLSVGDQVVVATFSTARSSGNGTTQQQGGMGQNGGFGQPPDLGSGNGPQGNQQPGSR